jgi:hypothetical protein
MPCDDPVMSINENWDNEAKLLDASSKLANLGIRMFPWVAWMASQLAAPPINDLGYCILRLHPSI